MSEARLPGGEADRLGDRLRTSADVTEADLAMLQQLRREFDDAMARARDEVVHALPDVSPTTRLKTVQTLVGKLRRETTMNLGQVHGRRWHEVRQGHEPLGTSVGNAKFSSPPASSKTFARRPSIDVSTTTPGSCPS